MRRIERDAWQRQAWKNGGGVTHELWREGTGPSGFSIRLSCAEVTSDGPFSEFPGVDRTIVLVRGEGFVLRRDDGLEAVAATVGSAWTFRGEERWSCRLVAGPVLDLNVMTDRAAVDADVTVHTLEAGASVRLDAPTVVAFVLEEGPIAATNDGTREVLGHHEALVAAGAVSLEATVRTRVVLAALRRAPRPPPVVGREVQSAYESAVVEIVAPAGSRFSRPMAEPCWVVTACNPGAKRLTDAANHERMRLLTMAVEARGIAWTHAVGRNAGNTWREPSVALAGCGRDGALWLAEQFDQDAIFELLPGGPPVVISCG